MVFDGRVEVGRMVWSVGGTKGQPGGWEEWCLQLGKALPEGDAEFPQGEEGMSQKYRDVTGF